MAKLSQHFDDEEFACRCGCGYKEVNPKLVDCLERLRETCGNRPIIISSGCRCKEHNAAVGGAERSQHLKGNAADIKVAGLSPWQVMREAERLELFGGLHAYETFTHVDVGPNRRW